jgi:hypothetical protein
MNRIYNTGKKEMVRLFVGDEVEHTPAFGLRTLFVVGLENVEEIQDWLDDFNSRENTSEHIKHIYFGANQSFPNLDTNDAQGWEDWETMISFFLKKDFFCTLDIDIRCVTGLLEGGLCEYNNFIPMISAKIPYIQQLGYNAIIKIDSQEFQQANPGVWCHSLHDLMDRSKFTSWNQYRNDKVLK